MLKLLGTVFVVAASAFVGFGFAANVRSQAQQLEALLGAMDYMKSEISCRLTPLPELFYLLSRSGGKAVGAFFGRCAALLTQNPGASLQGVFLEAMKQTPQLAFSKQTRQTLLELALQLGKFDAAGTAGALDLASARLRHELQILDAHRRERCRSYETLGICTGLALAVILL